MGLYHGLVSNKPEDTIDPYDIGTYLLHQDYQVFCWLHVRSFHLLIFTSYHLGCVPFLIEFIILVIPFFWVHFSCFGYRSYSFVFIFVSSVLGCKPHVSSSFSLLDYHFSFFEHHLGHTPIIESFRSSLLVSWFFPHLGHPLVIWLVVANCNLPLWAYNAHFLVFVHFIISQCCSLHPQSRADHFILVWVHYRFSFICDILSF